MLKIVKLYVFIAASILCLDAVTPHASYARPRGSVSATSYDNVCGLVPAAQTWCVNGSTGFTVFSPSPKTNGGTACANASSTTDETCIVAISNSGNDGTCQAESVPSGMTYSAVISSSSSYTPSLPCATWNKAQSLLRNNSADWLLAKRGDTWEGGVNSTLVSFSATWGLNGRSVNAPLVVGAYGSGARPKLIKKKTSGDIYFASTTSGGGISKGEYQAWIGIEFYAATLDPNSSEYLGATITGDTTSGSATISNVTVPSFISSGQGGAAYGAWASGINNQNVTYSAGAPTTLTLSGTAGFTATGLKIQVLSRQVNSAALSWQSGTNLLILEDNKFNWTEPYQTTDNTLSPLRDLQIRWRRNIATNSWQIANGSNFYISANYPYSDSYALLEENVVQYGGWNPYVWAGSYSGQTHCLYMHDPGQPYIIKKNIIANCSSTGVQFREGGTLYNNLFANVPIAAAIASTYWAATISYNVHDGMADKTVGFRTVTADAASGTTITFDGVVAYPVNLTSAKVVNLSNPGSIPSVDTGGSPTTVSSLGATTATISASIAAGIRGDGVKTGDILFFTNSQGDGFDVNSSSNVHLSLNSGPETGGAYPGGSTVSITAASPAVVTDTAKRSNNELVKFTAGTLPTGLSLNTAYCTNIVTSLTYNLYPTTANGCPGASSNLINTTGSNQSGITRDGSHWFTFSTAPFTNWTPQAIPSTITADPSTGSSVCLSGGGSQNFWTNTNPTTGCGIVQWISSDRYSFQSSDGSTFSLTPNGDVSFIFGAPTIPGLAQTVSPNNIFLRYTGLDVGGGGAFHSSFYANNVDFTGNYAYNVDPRGTSSTIQQISKFAASNTVSPFAVVGGVSQNLANSTSHPRASVAAYDAETTNNVFTATISPTGSGGAYLDVTAGTGPSVGDQIFAADGSNSVSQYTEVTFQISASRWLLKNNTQTIASPTNMINGSYQHFIDQAVARAPGTWDTRWTANAANNYIRLKMGCDVSATPACPQQ